MSNDFRFIVNRVNSLDPLEVIADATRQAQAESLVKEKKSFGTPDGLSCHYEIDGTDVCLVVRGEEAPVRDIAGQMNTRYANPEPKVEEITSFDSEDPEDSESSERRAS